MKQAAATGSPLAAIILLFWANVAGDSRRFEARLEEGDRDRSRLERTLREVREDVDRIERRTRRLKPESQP